MSLDLLNNEAFDEIKIHLREVDKKLQTAIINLEEGKSSYIELAQCLRSLGIAMSVLGCRGISSTNIDEGA